MNKTWITIIRIAFFGIFLFLMLIGKPFIWLALYTASLVSALLFGRIYCGFMCPINTVMGPAEFLSKKMNIQTEKTPKWLSSGVFAWVFLGISIALMLVFKKAVHIDIPIIPIWITAGFLITLRYKPHVFHNLICPFGTLQGLFGRKPLFSKKVHKETCIGCRLCEKACPSDAIKVSSETKKATITANLCHQCTNCKDVCPKDAILYKRAEYHLPDIE